MRPELPLYRDARAIFQAGVDATDPRAAVLRSLRRNGRQLQVGDEVLDLDHFDRIVVLGAGKAAAEMAAAVEQVVPVDHGMVVVKPGHGVELARVEVRESGHPVPDDAGLEAALHLLDLAAGLGERDHGFLRVAARDVGVSGRAARDVHAEQLDGPLGCHKQAMDLVWRSLGVWPTVLAPVPLVNVIA